MVMHGAYVTQYHYPWYNNYYQICQLRTGDPNECFKLEWGYHVILLLILVGRVGVGVPASDRRIYPALIPAQLPISLHRCTPK